MRQLTNGKSLTGLFAIFLLTPVAWAQLGPYSQDFESLDMSNPAALTDDGWLDFGNVFDGGGAFKFGYGPFGAPNGGPGFSAIVGGEGGPPQGEQQLSVYSDYNCCDLGLPEPQGHGNGTDIVEANVFQERTIGAADLGTEWQFSFEAKAGNIELDTTAFAFIKVLDAVGGTFATLAFPTVETTATPTTWTGYSITIEIDPAWEGQILQFGFLSNASNFAGSGIFYDNVNFDLTPPPVAVGGSVAGQLGFLAQCINQTTGQVVSIPLGGAATSWDCNAAGLVTSTGDTVLQFGAGPFTGPALTGNIDVLSGQFAVCRNLTTGQLVPIVLGGATSWNCTAAGLAAAPGQLVIQISKGIVN